MIPVTILSGFLGSGKTTLVNRLLSRPGGLKYAVLVNEFGDVGIDGRLIVAAEEDLVELANGCVCCTIRGDLERGLRDLAARRNRLMRGRRFDGALIEASGLASPGPIAQTLSIVPDLAATYALRGIVTLAHSAHIAEQLTQFPEAREQIGLADWIVLNHTDQVEPSELDTARAAVFARNAIAHRVETQHAEVYLEALEANLVGRPLDMQALAAHAHQSDVTTVAFESDQALDIHRFKMWLKFLSARPDGQILRIKGIVRCSGHHLGLLVQGVYQYLEFGPTEDPAPLRSQLVVIGQHFDAEELRRGWLASHELVS